MNRRLSSSSVWLAGLGWLVLPLVTGPVLADALDSARRPVQVVASAGLWVGWAVVLAAALVPRTVSLTAVRVVAPAAVVAVGAAVAVSDEPIGWRVASLAAVLAVAGVIFAPSTGHAFVNGSSYGDETRFPLRIPGPLLLGPVELVWLALVSGAVAGPLLLATGLWVAGGLALAAGGVVVWWGARVLHGLARRWIVLVPAGLVLHDPLALGDPVLFRRAEVVWVGPAPSGSDALDVTRGALGLALELRLKEPVSLSVVGQRRHEPVTAIEVDRLLFTPSRPGALLRATRARRLG